MKGQTPLSVSKLLPLPHLHVSREEARPAVLEDSSCLAGDSAAMQTIRAQMLRISAHFRIVLITGEPGTGKEYVARALHRLSQRSEEDFLSYSAASFLPLVAPPLQRGLSSSSEELARQSGFDASLVEPSSFPPTAKVTLYLGDINALTHTEQLYLRESLKRLVALRNAEERPRLIFATDRDLKTLSAMGRFDPDLYRKISAVEMMLPPLRSRPDDITEIVTGMLGLNANSGDQLSEHMEARVLSRLKQHSWPGNVRELKQVVDLAKMHARGGLIEIMHLPPLTETAEVAPRNDSANRVERLDDVIHSHVIEVLMRCSGNKVRAAERLGISRSTLYRMLEAGPTSLRLE